ncbi:hypothetical protein [Cellulomonas sp. Y8]|uniref:HAAS signaling domain-containing protein n=1 Tax=Cellulomonas sp. Y8 TaxID=2591145 RepID=UPI0011CB21EC|nr:hypothetical protein [Cellulomonas sp. Y8]
MSGTQAEAGRAAAPATVAEYAARVRQHLAGMPAEQVDDLTDGLEADLADALADEVAPVGAHGDLIALFGPPADYARELRVAAGLPEPEPVPARRGLRARVRGMRADVRSTALRATAGMRRQPWWPGLRDFGLAVRPLWWVLRAWVVYQLLLQLAGGRYAYGGGKGGWVPADLPTWVLLTGLVVVSVQWGRGLWLPRSGRWLPAATGALAVVLLIPAVIWAGNGAVRWQTGYDTAYVEQPSDGIPREDGVWVDGMQVSNLFVYDADGNPLSDVQVYDDRGRPVRTTTDEGWSTWSLPGVTEDWNFLPATDEDGRTRWNVYPLLGAPNADFEWDRLGIDESAQDPVDVLTAEPRVPPRPFAKAPSVVDRRAAEEPATGPSAGPSAGPSGEPSAAPSADPAAAETAATAAQSSTRDGGPGAGGVAAQENAATTAP